MNMTGDPFHSLGVVREVTVRATASRRMGAITRVPWSRGGIAILLIEPATKGQ